MIHSREKKKSIFKRHSRSKVNPSDYSPKPSPKPSPKHHVDNISEKSDDRSESPIPEEKERGGKPVKKMKSFKRVAMTMKIGKRFMSRGGSSSEDTDAASLGPSEAGEDEVRENGENGEEGVDGGKRDVIPEKSEFDSTAESATKTTSKRPESLSAPPSSKSAGGVKLKKGSRSFRQDKQRVTNTMTPGEAPKKSFMRNFERRISAPGQFGVSVGTPAAQSKYLTGDPPNDAPLTPIVEVTNSEVSAPSVAGGDSVFSTEEDMFAVQSIKCCMWGQWMCVSNAGGHVMAFSFQMDNAVTTPKVLYTVYQ